MENQLQMIERIRSQLETTVPKTKTPINPNNIASLPFPPPQWNFFPMFVELFSVEALKVLVNTTHNTVHQYNEHNKWFHMVPLLKKLDIKTSANLPDYEYIRQMALVNYIGFHVTRDKLFDAIMELIKRIELADGTYCVVSYLAIYNQHQKFVESNYAFCSFKEGGVPPEYI
jgi:hypothetical protein